MTIAGVDRRAAKGDTTMQTLDSGQEWGVAVVVETYDDFGILA
jgi:hypothetical protein